MNEKILPPAESPESSRVVTVKLEPGQTREQLEAKVMRIPEYQAAATIRAFEGGSGNIHSTITELQEQTAKIQDGNMHRPEALLAAQSHTLDTLFNSLAQRAHSNMEAGYGEAAERYMKLALRAQNQCRTTIEALSAIKNPPVIYAKQANFANGPQQVNNGVMTPAEPMPQDVTHTQGTTIEQNKLSGENYGILQDTRASQAASRINQEVEAVGEIHRAKNR